MGVDMKVQLFDDQEKPTEIIDLEPCCGVNTILLVGCGWDYDFLSCPECSGGVELESSSFDFEEIEA